MNDYKIKKHSIVISQHKTSITLENIFWENIVKIAKQNNVSVNTLITEIDKNKTNNLSSEIRVFVLKSILNKK